MIGRKVIVTGGAGFIGSHVAAALVDAGHDVHVIDDLSSSQPSRVPAAACLHVLDIRDTIGVHKVMQGADTVFHLAALSGVALSFEDPVGVHSVNVLGTVCTLDAARRAGVRRFVYSSSSAVYGDQAVIALHEELHAMPQSPYGLSKYEGELATRHFSQVFGIESVCLRYFNVYGIGQDPNSPYAAVIAQFVQASKAGRPLRVVGDGRQTRDFIIVGDVVLANLAAASSQRVGRGEVINVGTGAQTRIVDLARLIGQEIEFVPPRQEIRNSRAETSRARELLGFVASTAIEDGLRRLGLGISATGSLRSRS